MGYSFDHQELDHDTPFVEKLNSARARQRIITQREAEELLVPGRQGKG
jgi:hypothetical protein